MSMNVIDISSYQGDLNLGSINYDGVAIKATEGNGYVNPFCDQHYQEAKAAGKKRAVYHFYDFNVDPITQADFFVDNCLGYVRDAIFILDWEGAGVDQVGNAAAFCQHVEARTGIKPAIYMSEWVENAYDWSSLVANDNGLWLAKYSNWEVQNHAQDWDFSNAGQAPNTVHWPFYFMWQWTSTGHLSGYAGNLDCDIAFLGPDQWDAYAGVPPAPAVPSVPVPPVTEPTTTEAPVPVVTTTSAPVAPETTSTTTDATTVAVTHPVPEIETTTTTPQTTGVPTPPDARPSERTTWLQVVWTLIIYITERLQGKAK